MAPACLVLLSWLPYWVISPPMLLWSVSFSLGVPCLCPHVTLPLSFSHHQGQKVATCLFITCPRSSETRSSCKCSCLLATSSLPKSLWTERPIRANVLVSVKKKKKNRQQRKIEINRVTLTHCFTQAYLTRRWGLEERTRGAWCERVAALIA